jgi:hypothetical protein
MKAYGAQCVFHTIVTIEHVHATRTDARVEAYTHTHESAYARERVPDHAGAHTLTQAHMHTSARARRARAKVGLLSGGQVR